MDHRQQDAATADNLDGTRASSAFTRVFQSGRLSVGLVMPLTQTRGGDTQVGEQLAMAELADRLGFDALWVRDVPLNHPDYPDPQGHLDPWVFLGALASRTRRIVLGSAAIVAPVRHPLHIAKAALSTDAVSDGRFILGLGSGDRLPEFAAFGLDADDRDEAFREKWQRVATAVSVPQTIVTDMADPAASAFELRPQPVHGSIPMIAIGSSHQSLGWIARNALGWVTYYRPHDIQKDRFALWHQAVGRLEPGAFRGLGQSFQLELLESPVASASPLPLGMRLGSAALIDELQRLQRLGAHHVLLNLNGSERPLREVLAQLSEEVLPAVRGS